MPASSHPAIRFKHIPIVEGRLFEFEKIRPRVLKTVVQKTMQEFSSSDLDLLLSEALYLEKQRIRKMSGLKLSNAMIMMRTWRDQEVWKRVQSQLFKKSTEFDRTQILELGLQHWAEEIGGHFDDRVYRLATHLVPFGFNWLLNAASVRNFIPWKMTESLESQMRILGEIPHLQKLAQKGTILLVPTHQSNIDSILIGYVIYLMSLPPFSYGGGLNLFSNPILSFFMSRLGAYTVDRQKNNVLYKALLKNYSTEILKEGVHSIFFPGGGRSRTGALESKLKLGLLGTGLTAQLQNYQSGKKNPNVYVVPMVMSYHFVFEAASLIEDYLSSLGKHRFFGSDSVEPFFFFKITKFFWKLFSAQTGISVRIGKPLDVFGNLVDEDGNSIGPNGTIIDPKKWLTTRGELKEVLQRDQEYTRQLGERLVDRYYKENLVLTSHVVAFVLFSMIRKKYPELDLFRFLRLSKAQRTVTYSSFMEECERFHKKLVHEAQQGAFYLSQELLSGRTEEWVKDGMKQLGVFHTYPVVRAKDDLVWTEDMNLLYYYRNRLSGYGFSLYALTDNPTQSRGAYDKKGFLV